MKEKLFQLALCEHCKTFAPDGTFCGNCGQRLQKRNAYKSVIKCYHCGKIVADNQFCAACGQQLVETFPLSEVEHIINLVKHNSFSFNEQEKQVVLYFLSKPHKGTSDERYIFEAPISDIYTRFDIKDDNLAELSEKLDSLLIHSSVIIEDETRKIGFNWITFWVNKKENKIWLVLSEDHIKNLNMLKAV